MGKPILLLRLEGPLQSWGSRARWDVRDTAPEPTKSGVIGLLGCALGYGIGDPRLEALSAGLRFGVRVEHPGAILEDYQTITDFLPTADGRYKHSRVSIATSLSKLRADPNATPATIISPRFYLEDAAFLVALEEQVSHPGLAQQCALALQKPVWPLFLGRKACIATRPIFEAYSEVYADLEAVLRSYAWSWLGAQNKNRTERGIPERLRVLVEPQETGAGDVLRQDALRVGAARQYGLRPEREITAVERAAVNPLKGDLP
ncbi:MAG: cas5 [Chthonomonadaceae bacterium]|nr:cas5 [Chthonomonadaceae bacterium]